MLIRRMTENDLDDVMDIEKECFTLPWSRASYEGELSNKFSTYLVIDIDGEIAAYGGVWTVFEEGRITNVAVAPRFRGQHLGEALMLALEEEVRRRKGTLLLLEVRASNAAAISLYNKLGFIQTGVRAKYYIDNNEDALSMTKLLVGSGKPHLF
ncbi:MAG: ribosomal protein S18-alanine N-acetyltransferase [Syntrophomonadaceae bacterium]|nr:ribosomal protein S18-alanine N-acetyltransferase [Syntrophomonadaceae bacterium]